MKPAVDQTQKTDYRKLFIDYFLFIANGVQDKELRKASSHFNIVNRRELDYSDVSKFANYDGIEQFLIPHFSIVPNGIDTAKAVLELLPNRQLFISMLKRAYAMVSYWEENTKQATELAKSLDHPKVHNLAQKIHNAETLNRVYDWIVTLGFYSQRNGTPTHATDLSHAFPDSANLERVLHAVNQSYAFPEQNNIDQMIDVAMVYKNAIPFFEALAKNFRQQKENNRDQTKDVPKAFYMESTGNLGRALKDDQKTIDRIILIFHDSFYREAQNDLVRNMIWLAEKYVRFSKEECVEVLELTQKIRGAYGIATAEYFSDSLLHQNIESRQVRSSLSQLYNGLLESKTNVSDFTKIVDAHSNAFTPK